MTSSLETLRTEFSRALAAAFGEDYRDTDPLVFAATDPKFGDYQANVAMSLSKRLKQKPRDIAQTLVDNLELGEDYEAPVIAGPGFINLTFTSSYVERRLAELQQDERLGVAPVEPAQTVIVDFSSPNIAKEMHVGHLRSTIIGDSIARILEFRGHNVIRLNHVGDWGTQFGMLITYLQEAYPEALTTANALDLGDLVTFYKRAKQRFDEDEIFKEVSRQAVVKLQGGDPESDRAWRLLCEQSRREFQVIYDRLDISLTERGESFYNQFLADVVKSLNEIGLLEENDGAKCVFLDGFTNKEGDPLPLIVQKSDGGYNYATTDLASIQYRINQDGGERLIYVTDAGQSNHFAQVFQVTKRAGWLPESVEAIHVPFGLVLGEDGKKLKTRAGDTIKLRELLDEAVTRARQDLDARLADDSRSETEEFKQNVAQVVGLSAVKYADLSQNRTGNYKFSFDKMLSLKGNTAPYMLYAYARVQSISRQGGIDLSNLPPEAKVVLNEPTEIALAKFLLKLPEILQQVERDLLPNQLCSYLFELSQNFNRFYENCQVLKAEEPQRTSRLILSNLTANTLKLGLSLLGIAVLERM